MTAWPAAFASKRLWNLRPGVAFLNHGSFGACPNAILALQSRFRQEMEAEPVQFLWRRFEERLQPSRVRLAQFVGAGASDLVFVNNATAAVNAVLRSVKLRRGDQILTTNLDYNACRNVLLHRAAECGGRVVVAEVPFPVRSCDDVLEAVLGAVTKRTRLAFLDHVTSGTGLILPIDRLVRELERKGIDTFVDGAHAPGMLSLDLKQLRPAWYTGNLHKWVCAPKGAAFLWVREDKQGDMQPASISHGNNTPRNGYSAFQDRFDWTGTFDPSPWFCVGPAIDWMEQLIPGGWSRVQRLNHQKVIAARRLLCDALRLDPPAPESMLGSMATLPLPTRLQGRPRHGKIDPEQLRLYDDFRIEVPFVRVNATRYFRISAHVYNTRRDYQRLAEALAVL